MATEYKNRRVAMGTIKITAEDVQGGKFIGGELEYDGNIELEDQS